MPVIPSGSPWNDPPDPVGVDADDDGVERLLTIGGAVARGCLLRHTGALPAAIHGNLAAEAEVHPPPRQAR